MLQVVDLAHVLAPVLGHTLRCLLCLGGYLHVCHVVDPHGAAVELGCRKRGVGEVAQQVARALITVLDIE